MWHWLINHKKLVIVSTLILGAVARLAVSFHGYNFDVESYWIVGEIMRKGGNVYAETVRYNYGPIWFLILGGLYDFSSNFANHFEVFRFSISALLTVVDLGIFYILYKQFGAKIGILFFLNPISIIISGYHSQFDNLAIFFALIGVVTLGDAQVTVPNGKQWRGLFWVGISLVTKHILFAFPLWLAIKQKSWLGKFTVLTFPVAIFAAGFLPYWNGGKDGIIQNVFLYRSASNGPFWNSLSPAIVQNNLPAFLLFLGALFILGFVLRKKNNLDTLILYLGGVVIFSSAIANQYLAIAVAFVARYFNIGTALFTAIATVFLLIHEAGLHLDQLSFIPEKLVALNIQIIFLTLGFALALYRKQVMHVTNSTIDWIKDELKFQLTR